MMVDPKGIEPSTSALRTRRSSQLSYGPLFRVVNRAAVNGFANTKLKLYRLRSQLSYAPECEGNYNILLAFVKNIFCPLPGIGE